MVQPAPPGGHPVLQGAQGSRARRCAVRPHGQCARLPSCLAGIGEDAALSWQPVRMSVCRCTVTTVSRTGAAGRRWPD